MVEISRMMKMPIAKLTHYSALMKKVPSMGDIDLNYYLNGHYEYEKKKRDEKAAKIAAQPFKPKDEWWL